MPASVLSFLIAVAFWPGIAGAATVPRWALAALSLYFLSPWCLPFVAWCFWKLDFDQAMHWTILCGALSWGARDGNDAFWRLDVGAGSPLRRDAIIQAFCLGIAVSSVLAIMQSLGYVGVPQIVAPSGLFLNKNTMGEAAAVAFAASLLARRPERWSWLSAARYWWPALMTLPAIVLSGARAAQIASFTAFWLWLPWRWRLLAGGLALVLLPFVWPTMFGPHLNSLAQRMVLWNDALTALSPWGLGDYDFSTVQHREPYLHNDWLQFVYELGVVGAAPVLVIVAVTVRGGAVFSVPVVVIASFGFPLHMPATGWLIAYLCGAYLRCRTDDDRNLARVRHEEPGLRRARRSPQLVPVSPLHRSRPCPGWFYSGSRPGGS